MKRVFFIIILLLTLVVAGCKSVRHSTEDVQKEKIVLVTKDSIVCVYDTTEVVKYVTQYIDNSNTIESAMMEWWDNYTREWTDSMGNVIKETYEKGNRQSSVVDQSRYISSLTDSLLYYKGVSLQWQDSYSDLQKEKTDNLIVTKEVVKKEKVSFWVKIWSFLSGVVTAIGILAVMWFARMYKRESEE